MDMAFIYGALVALVVYTIVLLTVPKVRRVIFKRRVFLGGAIVWPVGIDRDHHLVHGPGK